MTNIRYRTKGYSSRVVNADPTVFEIHVTKWVENFTRKFGRKIKRTGGSYSECRGHTSTRFVKIPNTPEGREVADAVIAADRAAYTDKRTTVVLRGIAATLPAWVTVHEVTSTADALAKFQQALDNAADRGIIERFEGKTEDEKKAEAIAKIEDGDLFRDVNEHAFEHVDYRDEGKGCTSAEVVEASAEMVEALALLDADAAKRFEILIRQVESTIEQASKKKFEGDSICPGHEKAARLARRLRSVVRYFEAEALDDEDARREREEGAA